MFRPQSVWGSRVGAVKISRTASQKSTFRVILRGSRRRTRRLSRVVRTDHTHVTIGRGLHGRDVIPSRACDFPQKGKFESLKK